MESEYSKKCEKILVEPSIRFAAIIDESGTIMVGGMNNEIKSKLNDERINEILKEIASRVSKRKKDDKELGRVKYSASRREDVVIMSFPIYQNALVVVGEPNINIDRLAWKIINILGEQWGSFVGK